MDTNSSQRLVRQNPENLSQCLDAVVAFGNAHLMQKAQNKLAVISCHHHATLVLPLPFKEKINKYLLIYNFFFRDFLYPMPVKQLDVRQVDGQYEAFSLVEKTVKQRLSHIITNAPKISQPTESLLAGSMSMALCYISRVIFFSSI